EPLCWVLLGLANLDGVAEYLPAASLGGVLDSNGGGLPLAGSVGIAGGGGAAAPGAAGLRFCTRGAPSPPARRAGAARRARRGRVEGRAIAQHARGHPVLATDELVEALQVEDADLRRNCLCGKVGCDEELARSLRPSASQVADDGRVELPAEMGAELALRQ